MADDVHAVTLGDSGGEHVRVGDYGSVIAEIFTCEIYGIRGNFEGVKEVEIRRCVNDALYDGQIFRENVRAAY